MIAPFYLITDDVDRLTDFLAVGLQCVQLRIKNRSDNEIRQAIRQAKSLCEAYGCQLIINDYWKLAIDEGCNAIHLGQEDLDTANLPAIRSAGIRYGISTHDRTELQRALDSRPDYIALGPVYATLLKQMPWRPQGLEKLGRWKTRIGDIPLVAIGGLTPERAAGVFKAGADSICVVTDVQAHSNPAKRVEEWLNLCEELLD